MFFTHAMYVCAANVRTGVEIGKKKKVMLRNVSSIKY